MATMGSPLGQPNPLLDDIRQRARQSMQANPPQPQMMPPPGANDQAPSITSEPGPTVPIKGQRFAPGTLEGEQAHRNVLVGQEPGANQVYGKITGSDFGQNHPLAGKLLGGLAQGASTIGDIAASGILPQVAPAAASLIPGTTIHHNALVNRENQNINQMQGEQQKTAETQNVQSQIPLHEAQTAAAELTPATEEEAAAMNVPVGTPLNAASKAALAGKAGQNQTKLDVAQENQKFKNTPQYQLGQQYMKALDSGDSEGAQKILDQMKNVSMTTPQGVGTQGRLDQAKNALAEKVREFQSTDQFRRWKEQLDKQTQLQVAKMSQGKAPAAMMQSAEFASGGLNTLNDARSEMAWLESKGVMGSNVAQNKVEDWVFGKGAVDPSLDPETRYHIGKLRSAMELTSSAMLRAHTGRTSKEIYDDFKKMMGPGQDWSALSGAMDESDNLLGHYANMASSQNIENLRSGNAAPKPQTPSGPSASSFKVKLADAMALPQNKGKTDAEVEADVKKHGGEVVR